MISSGV